MKKSRFITIILFLIFAVIFSPWVMIGPVFAQEVKSEDIQMKVYSPDFESNKMIPKKFTCDAENISPALIIENIPKEAKSLALIVDDPDAPVGIWVHWVVYDIPVTSRIEEAVIPGTQGLNDSGDINYGGPCPPSGSHRYFFKVYALDVKLNLKEGTDRKSLEKAMEGHTLDKAELMGVYKRS